MIRAITFTSNMSVPAASEKEASDKNMLAQKGKYHDPLNHWSVKTALYSNELGAAINEIAPTLGLALWIPTFMYLGADIYDKYKNDKDHYNPSSKRGVKRAVFQTFSTLALPAMALYAGQKLVSPLGKLSKNKLSLNAMDQTFNHCKHFISQCPNEALNEFSELEKMLQNSLKNRVNSLKTDYDRSNIFKKFLKYFTSDITLVKADKKHLYNFAHEHAKRIFEIKESLQQNIQPKGLSANLFKKFAKEKYWQEIYGENYISQAIKFSLKQYEKHLLFRTKLLKTAGGLAALLLLSKPIDYFTRNILMDRFINPGIDMLVNKEFNKTHVIKNLLTQKTQDNSVKDIQASSKDANLSNPAAESKDLAASKLEEDKIPTTPTV